MVNVSMQEKRQIHEVLFKNSCRMPHNALKPSLKDDIQDFADHLEFFEHIFVQAYFLRHA